MYQLSAAISTPIAKNRLTMDGVDGKDSAAPPSAASRKMVEYSRRTVYVEV